MERSNDDFFNGKYLNETNHVKFSRAKKSYETRNEIEDDLERKRFKKKEYSLREDDWEFDD